MQRSLTNLAVADFVLASRRRAKGRLSAVSLFSGAGLSDAGYEAAGFRFWAHAEKQEARAGLGRFNFPDAEWFVGDVRERASDLIRHVDDLGKLDLLVATPPCQGLSSSNPSRGKRSTGSARTNEEKNSLLLAAARIAREVKPRIFVAENVRQILTLEIRDGGVQRPILDVLRDQLPDYRFWHRIINVADFGVPQVRRRAVIVGINRDEPVCQELTERNLAPWPTPTHAVEPVAGRQPWISLRDWIEEMGYECLDAKTKEAATGTDPLHFVPHYDNERYGLVKGIPRNSGRSAYENDRCPSCSAKSIPIDRVRCPECRRILTNRPIVREGRSVRLIAGFKSSYRRMRPDQPARTVTTNSSHVGSDFKIHPSEHRVLSALECSDLQTVPRWFDWSVALDSGRSYLIRNVIGEAFPPYFTFLHGLVLKRLLTGTGVPWKNLERWSAERSGWADSEAVLVPA